MQAALYLRKHEVRTVFHLLGEHENHMTYSLAWALAKSPAFLETFLRRVVDPRVETSGVLIRLQHYEPHPKEHGGFTDVEIESPGRFFLIVEAKRGWTLPKLNQLEKYGSRFKNNGAKFKRLVVLSECSSYYAEAHLDAKKVAGVPIEPVSWKDMFSLAEKAQPNGSHAEKRLIDEVLEYLGGIVTIQDHYSNRVYVVALGLDKPEGADISWIDIVKKRRRYFHPVGGKSWPNEPPNYLAFRYDGRLQSIHHVESYEVATNMHNHIREMPNHEWDPHYLYRLGPPFYPGQEVRTGKLYTNAHHWCMLDTLFTCNTIAEARKLTKKREGAAE